LAQLVRAAATRYTVITEFDEANGPAMRAVLEVILFVLQMYVWLLIAAAVLSWLIAFNVVNVRNQFVGTIGDFLYRITEPVLRPIRNVMPNLGGLDISPIVVIIIIFFIIGGIGAASLSRPDLRPNTTVRP